MAASPFPPPSHGQLAASRYEARGHRNRGSKPLEVKAASPAQAHEEQRPWWESRACLVAVVLATMLPLIYPAVPPLVDLLGHMGRYRVELDLGHSPWLRQYYDYHWAAIGNLGVALLIAPLGKRLGLEPAVNVRFLPTPPM